MREKINSDTRRTQEDGPPAYSSSGRPSSSSYVGSSSSASTADAQKNKDKGKRGFFGKMVDKTIGTKEEREAQRLAEQRAVRQVPLVSLRLMY